MTVTGITWSRARSHGVWRNGYPNGPLRSATRLLDGDTGIEAEVAEDVSGGEEGEGNQNGEGGEVE